jgi:hypothetical protein
MFSKVQVSKLVRIIAKTYESWAPLSFVNMIARGVICPKYNIIIKMDKGKDSKDIEYGW